MLQNLSKKLIVEAVRHLVSGTSSQFIPGETYISPHGIYFDGDDVATLVECALGGWFTEGGYTKEYVQKLRLYLENSVRYVSLTNSGSSANLLAITAMTQKEFGERAIKPGDKVITTALGFPTTVNAIIQNGAIPVFIDVDLHTLAPDMDCLEQAIVEGDTKAVVLAHTLGNPFDADKVEDICREYDVWMMSDSCDSLGAKYNGKPVESYGDFSTHSYFPAHHISGAEGGAVLTNSSMSYKVVQSLKSWGKACWCNPGQDNACGRRFEQETERLPFGYDHKYIFDRIGYNLKPTDLQAALLVSQIDKLHDVVSDRQYNYMYLSGKMEEFSKWLIFPEAINDLSDPSWFGFPIIIKAYAGIERAELVHFLNEKKIGTRMFFGGNLLRQPAYKNIQYETMGELYNSDLITEYGFWIGLHSGITQPMMDYVVKSFREFFKNK